MACELRRLLDELWQSLFGRKTRPVAVEATPVQPQRGTRGCRFPEPVPHRPVAADEPSGLSRLHAFKPWKHGLREMGLPREPFETPGEFAARLSEVCTPRSWNQASGRNVRPNRLRPPFNGGRAVSRVRAAMGPPVGGKAASDGAGNLHDKCLNLSASEAPCFLPLTEARFSPGKWASRLVILSADARPLKLMKCALARHFQRFMQADQEDPTAVSCPRERSPVL